MKSAREFINIALVVMAILLAPVSAIAAQVVDINRADAATMIENWKGIGEKKARAIVSYRKSNGPFGSINDLENVKGIGEGIIKNNRKYMSVSKGVFKPTGKSDSSTKKSATKDTAKDTKKTSKDKKKSSTKKSSSAKSTAKESKSTAKKSTSKKSTSKKSTSKKSKTKKCKTGSKDKECVKKSKKKKKKTT